MVQARTASSARRRMRAGVGAAIALGLALLGGQGLAIPAATAADVPSPALTAPFFAPQCTDNEPVFDPTQRGRTLAEDGVDVVTDDDGFIRDLTQVFGERLVAYNAGLVVPLYESYSGAPPFDEQEEAGYPPLCGVRYDAESGGHVSEWMFCTDPHSAVCGNMDGFGNQLSEDGDLLDPMLSLSGNPRIAADSDEERLISYLISNGFEGYQGIGAFDYPESEGHANAETSIYTRDALQILIWCVSDNPSDPVTHVDFAPTCAANIGPEVRAEILAKVPRTPVMELAFTEGTQQVALGATAKFTLKTNIYNQPINLTATPAGAVTVCDGPGVLGPDGLVVSGTNSDIPTVITLFITANSPVVYSLSASAKPILTRHIEWNQNQHRSGTDHPCQVFANFDSRSASLITSTDLVTFAKILPSTGAEVAPWTVFGTLGLLAVGSALLMTRFRAKRS